MANTIPERGRIDARYCWRIEDIYPSPGAWRADAEKLKALIGEIPRYQGKIAQDPLEALRTLFAGQALAEKLNTYAAMQKDTDGGNAEYQAMYDTVSALIVAAQSAASYIRPELAAMDASALKALADDPAAADYSRYTDAILRDKPHILSAPEERAVAMAGDMARASEDIYDAFTNVDMRFPDVHNEAGEPTALSDTAYQPLIHSADRRVRSEAFRTLFSTYASYGNTLGAAYAASVKRDLYYARMRKFQTCMEAKLYDNEIPLPVYGALVSAVNGALPVLADYLAVRKKALGLTSLHMYDLYCPIIRSFHMDMPYEDAYKLVLEGLEPLGPEYVRQVAGARRDGWIDVYPSQGKRSGAYATHSYGVHPYVLLNHTDNLDGALTIAHEIGHAMHSFYTMNTQPFPKAGYAIFVAEVASTLNEIIMIKRLMARYRDNRDALAYLCNNLLEQFRTVVFRQTLFAQFEQASHAMAEAGEPLTRDALSAQYYRLNKTYYGAVCEVDDLIRDEWLRIPHFYSSFYVYQYATGYSAAVTLADKILREGDSALKPYKAFLSAGSSVPPIEALKLAGVDMSRPEPVMRAMDTFRDTLETFKTLL